MEIWLNIPIFAPKKNRQPETLTHMQNLPNILRSCISHTLLLLSLCTAFSGWAQYRITEHILINEGLSNNFVHDIRIDNKGRLWIATESGLDSYNGISFTSFNMNNSGLSANMINCLWYDSEKNQLWAGTKGAGINCLSPETGQVTNYNVPDSSLTNVLHITEADSHQLWLISPNDIMQLDINTGEINPIELGQVNQFFQCGVDDGNGNLIIGSHMQGASVLNARTLQLTPLTFDGADVHRVNVNEVYKDHYGRIWLATNAGLWFYQPGSTHLVPFSNANNVDIINIEEIDDRQLWLVTRQEILSLDLSSEQVKPLHFEGEIALPRDVQTIHQDTFGNIWIGSAGGGIEFISHSTPFFHKFQDSPFWGIYAEGDITWVGTRDQVLGFRGTECIHKYDLAATPLNGRKQSFGIVLSINGNGGDLLYLAVPNHCLALNKSTGQLSDITTPEGHSIDAITFYSEDNGTLWITTTDGIYTMQEGKAVECQPIMQTLNKQSIHGIRRDKQGKFWVATYENGIYLLDTDFNLIRNLSQQTGFFSNSIQHLKFDSKDRLWMSTPDGPCCIPDTSFPEQYITYGYAEGLLDTYIRAIQEDRNGNIWMSTNNGISMLNLSDRTFNNYSQSDYVPLNNLNGGAILQPDGGLLFTSMEGLCLCYPDSLKLNQKPVEANLHSVQVLGTDDQNMSQLTIRPDAKGIYHLKPEQNSFRIYFGTRDYAQNHITEYEYQMDNSSKKWIRCSRGIVSFRNLSPGTYNIRVRSRLKGQPWSDQNCFSTTITIHHPWWWSVWARICYTLLFLAAIYAGFRLYLHRLRLTSELELERRKNLVEQEHNTERLRFFTNITHELKTPLTLIQAPLEELLQDNHLSATDQKRIRLVYDSSRRLSDLCNKLLDFRKAETNNQHLRVSKADLGSLVREIGQSFVELNTNPQLQILVEAQEVQEPFLFDAEVIRSILTNLLSNALKYTPQGSIHLQQEQHRDATGRLLATLRVSDTGYGIPAEALPHIFDRYYQVSGPHQASGTGIGLAIVRSLTELHKGEIKAESREGEGTTFTIQLDCSQTYPEAEHIQRTQHTQDRDVLIDSPEGEDDTRPIILLVEDDFQILNFMAESLSSDYRILRAHNGQEGAELAFEHTPDIVITDLMMPVMNGNILCRTLKNDLRTSHIPVIMLTAKDTPDDQTAGYADGADSYLTKPFSLKMLRTRLVNIIQARARMAEWLNSQEVNGTQPSLPSDTAEMPQSLSLHDQNFLRDVRAYIIEHIESDNIRMEDVAQSMNISHSTLYRKIKALTGLSGAEFIRKVRILQSAELLRSGHYNVSEAAYRCGFNNLPYFRSAFKEIFGATPSEYQKQ